MSIALLQEFVVNNSTLVLLALVAVVAIVAFVMYRRNNGSGVGMSPVPTPSHDLDGMESVNTVCDLSTGVCHPQNLTPEQEQNIMMQHQMMMQQMQQNQQEQQGQQGEQEHEHSQ